MVKKKSDKKEGKKRISLNFNISLTNRWLYTIIAAVILIAVVGVSYAYNSGGPPETMGHSAGELEVNIDGNPMTLQEAISDEKLGGSGGGLSDCRIETASCHHSSCPKLGYPANSGTYKSKDVSCNSDETLVSGGCSFGDHDENQLGSYPPNDNTWRCLSGGISAGKIVSKAVCCKSSGSSSSSSSDSSGGSVPSGMICGCSDGNGGIDGTEHKCGGLDPANSCPSGWEKHKYETTGGSGSADEDVLCVSGNLREVTDVYVCKKK